MSSSIDQGSVPSSRHRVGGKQNSNGSSTEAEETQPLISNRNSVIEYYNTLESRLGYKIVMGGCRHFGYWEKDTYWPFPLNRALRAMEEKIFDGLALPPGSKVLDSGCGEGIVAIEMHRRGKYDITGIEIVPHHLSKAWKRVDRAMSRMQVQEGKIKFRQVDFHDLSSEFEPASFDGVYACETLAHAMDVLHVLKNFFRIIRPGGRLCLVDYEHVPAPPNMTPAEKKFKEMYDHVIEQGAMQANWNNEEGCLKKWAEEAGFTNVQVEDYSDNITPLLRLFFVLAFIPYFFIRLLGLDRQFINTTAGYWGYKGHKYWKYKRLSADKPA